MLEREATSFPVLAVLLISRTSFFSCFKEKHYVRVVCTLKRNKKKNLNVLLLIAEMRFPFRFLKEETTRKKESFISLRRVNVTQAIDIKTMTIYL